MVSPRISINPEEEALREKVDETARVITGDPTATGEVRDPRRFLNHLESEADIHQIFQSFQGKMNQVRNDPMLPNVVADEQNHRTQRGLPPSVHLENPQNFIRGYEEWEKGQPVQPPTEPVPTQEVPLIPDKRIPWGTPKEEWGSQPQGVDFQPREAFSPTIGIPPIQAIGRLRDPMGKVLPHDPDNPMADWGPPLEFESDLQKYLIQAGSMLAHQGPAYAAGRFLGPAGISQMTSPFDLATLPLVAWSGPKLFAAGIKNFPVATKAAWAAAENPAIKRALAPAAPYITKGLRVGGKVLGAITEPITRGNFAERMATEAALQAGAYGAMTQAEPGIQRLPGPEWVKDVARGTTGFAGGMGTVAGLQVKGLARYIARKLDKHIQ